MYEGMWSFKWAERCIYCDFAQQIMVKEIDIIQTQNFQDHIFCGCRQSTTGARIGHTKLTKTPGLDNRSSTVTIMYLTSSCSEKQETD